MNFHELFILLQYCLRLTDMEMQDRCRKDQHWHCCSKPKPKQVETSAFRKVVDREYLRSYYKSERMADLQLNLGLGGTYRQQPRTNRNLKIPRACSRN